MPYQRGIRDEFNSDWSLSITSSLSGTFSLFARYRRATFSLRFVSLLAVAIAHNVLSFPPHLFLFPTFLFVSVRAFACLPSLSTSYLLSSLSFASRQAVLSFSFLAPSYLPARLKCDAHGEQYEFNLAVRR